MTPVEEDRRHRMAQLVWDVRHSRSSDAYQIVRGLARAVVVVALSFLVIGVVWLLFTLIGLAA